MARKLVVLAASIVLAVLPATSAAIAPWQVGESLRIAREAWPQSPCANRLTLLPVRPGYLVADAIGGALVDGSCTAWVDPNLYPYKFCTVLVHEAGHLAGLEHTTGDNIMSVDRDYYWDPCDRIGASTPQTPQAAAAGLAEVEPKRCRLVTVKGKWRRYRCGRHLIRVEVLDEQQDVYIITFVTGR